MYAEATESPAVGWKKVFVEPTVFSNVTSNMKIVQDEIFGPVVVIQTFKDEKKLLSLQMIRNMVWQAACLQLTVQKLFE